MIRVLRILEYTYPDAEVAISDMGRWGIGANQTFTSGGRGTTVRSATMLPESLEGEVPEAAFLGLRAAREAAGVN